MSDLDEIAARLRAFAAERDWERYHSPKNLVMALAGEVGELLAEFQWSTPDESQDVMVEEDKAAAVRDELADVGIYLLRLADVLGVDLADAMHDKINHNEARFPATGPGREGNGGR